MSHAIRGIEARLDVPLLHLTSRSISLTAVGEMLQSEIDPHFWGIQTAVNLLEGSRPERVRITTLRDAAHLLIGPVWAKLSMTVFNVEIEIFVAVRSGLWLTKISSLQQ